MYIYPHVSVESCKLVLLPVHIYYSVPYIHFSF